MKIGVDLGGTNIRVGLVDGNDIIVKKSVPCPAQQPAEEVLDCIGNLIAEIINSDVKGIGIGVPSAVDVEKGIVYNVVNIPSWKEVHLKEYLEKRFGVPAFLNNDANCFALGEVTYGACRDFSDVVGVTLGTGVGMGIIVNGQLYNGVNASAGEMGAIPYLDSDYEHYCSSSFFTRCYDITGKEAATRANEGDKEALEIWDAFGTHLGKFITAVLYAYAPEAIVFGGSIAAAYPLFEKSMKHELGNYLYPATLSRIKFTTSTAGDIAILGAAALVDAQLK
ncbi:MAG: ROK family protein [Bacteroidales bacterium]|nr:ROK family protein [Bacteroidales bacterium]